MSVSIRLDFLSAAEAANLFESLRCRNVPCQVTNECQTFILGSRRNWDDVVVGLVDECSAPSRTQLSSSLHDGVAEPRDGPLCRTHEMMAVPDPSGFNAPAQPCSQPSLLASGKRPRECGAPAKKSRPTFSKEIVDVLKNWCVADFPSLPSKLDLSLS